MKLLFFLGVLVGLYSVSCVEPPPSTPGPRTMMDMASDLTELDSRSDSAPDDMDLSSECVCETGATSSICVNEKTVLTQTATGRCERGECVVEETMTGCENRPAECSVTSGMLTRFTGSSCHDGACIVQEEKEFCLAGCCEDRCCQFVPSNKDAYGLPYQTMIMAGPPNGEFDTDTDCKEDASLGVCVYSTDESSQSACVCYSDRLVVGDLRITGERALVIMSSDTIEVRGTLDISAQGSAAGAGQGFAYPKAVVEGYAMGGTLGSRGGRFEGELLGSQALTPLAGGCAGQSVCDDETPGGGGGGALQLSATNAVIVTGAILANGGGGRGGASGGSTCLDGAGGGSGGAVLIEAPSVEISGSVWAKGGGGGSGATTENRGRDGSDGAPGTEPAQGGERQSQDPCLERSDVLSGEGGRGASFDQDATIGGDRDEETSCWFAGDVFAGAGGGGGGLGRIRINTRTGAQSCQCNGDFIPRPDFGTISSR